LALKKAKIVENNKDKKADLKLDEVVITDEDLVPLNLFDEVQSEMERKVRERNETIKKFIRGCQADVKIKQERIESEKLKKPVEQNVLITHLNKSMEDDNDNYFTFVYIHR